MENTRLHVAGSPWLPGSGPFCCSLFTPCAKPPSPSPSTSAPSYTVRGKNSTPRSLSAHRQPSVFLCAGIWRRGGCNTQEMALLPKPLPQILFKAGASVMGLGIGGKRGVCLCLRVGGKVWTCLSLCMHAYVRVCVCVCSEGAAFGLQAPQRGPMCCYQPLGLWDWQPRPETKQFVHFLEGQWTSVSVTESMTDGLRGL